MVALLVVGVKAQWHEVAELRCEPVVEGLRLATDKVARDEDIEDAGDEGHLFASRYGSGIAPFPAKTVNGRFHAGTVLLKLLVRCGYPFPPLIYCELFGVHAC